MKTIKIHYQTPKYSCLAFTFAAPIYDEKLERWYSSCANRYVSSRYIGDEYKEKIATMVPHKALTWGGTPAGSEKIGAKKENSKWDEIKDSLFKKVLRMKFEQNPMCLQMLLELDPKKHKLVDPYARKDSPDLVKALWSIHSEFKKKK